MVRVCNTRPLQWLQGQNSFTPCDGRRKEDNASDTGGGEDEVERDEESDDRDEESGEEWDEVDEEEWEEESSSLEDEESEEEDESDSERVLLLFLPLAMSATIQKYKGNQVS